MTDVWKSNARKFCEICKVWFADNRVSIEHHEAGQKHKANVQAKLRELGKQSKEKEKANAALEATLAMMESAALGSMGSQATTSSTLPCNTIGPALRPRQFLDPRAHQSSVSEMAKEMARRKKESGKRKETSRRDSHKKEVKHEKKEVEVEEPTAKKETSQDEDIVWVETMSDEGVAYYFHMYSGETTWQAPSNFLTAEQYGLRYTSLASNSTAVPNKEPGEFASSTTLNDEGDNSTVIQVKQEDSATFDAAPVDKIDEHLPVKQEVPDADSIAMAANFRIEDDEIPLPSEIPLPPPEAGEPKESDASPPGLNDQQRISGGQVKEEQHGVSEEEPQDEAQLSVKAEVDVGPTNGLDGDGVGEEMPESGKSELANYSTRIQERKAHPYGVWTRVEKSRERPKVDYELPTEAEGRVKKAEIEVKPEDVVAFTEKVAPISRKKKNLDAPVEFKKRKTNVNIRRRECGN